MSTRLLAVLALACLPLAACSMMEQFHRPAELSGVPSPIIAGFSRTYPNVTIKSIEEQAMYDNTTRYAFTVVDNAKNESVVVFAADGHEVKN